VLVEHIGELVTNESSWGGMLGIVRDAAVAIEGDRVTWVGEQRDVPEGVEGPRIDAEGGAVMPGFVDSHTHLVFAGDRTAEFDARMRGERYAAGGIQTTVEATKGATQERLRGNARRLRDEGLRTGTTHVEIKSGYALTVVGEQGLLELAGELTEDTTFLGAHVVPRQYAADVDFYVDLVRGPMLDACAPLAKWADVFCERGAFDEDQSRAILVAAKEKGLGLRVHANQLGPGPGAKLAAELGAASADHVTYLTEDDIWALSDAGVVATLLPVADLSTREPWPDARGLIEAGTTVALATDCNPGTSFTTNMPIVVALAVTAMRMTPAEAVWSATVGGARALQRDDVGTLKPGVRADLILLDAPSHVHLAYRPGVPLVRTVVRAGERVAG
jgi:imidazolonepropionase